MVSVTNFCSPHNPHFSVQNKILMNNSDHFFKSFISRIVIQRIYNQKYERLTIYIKIKLKQMKMDSDSDKATPNASMKYFIFNSMEFFNVS